MIGVVQGNFYTNFKCCNLSCDTYSLQLVVIAHYQKSFPISDGSKVKVIKCKTKVCSEKKCIAKCWQHFAFACEQSNGFSCLVLEKRNLGCCLVTEYFRCLNITVCDVYFAEGCQSCVFLLTLMRDVHLIFIRFLTGSLLYYDNIVRDFVR